MKRLMRRIHRWLGLLMALQIIAWMASGLWFALFPIAEIRGEHLTRPASTLELAGGELQASALPPPAALAQALDRHLGSGWGMDELRLVRHDGELAWRVGGQTADGPFQRLVSGDGSTVFDALDGEAARSRAEGWLLQPGQVAGVDWVETAGPDSEIRGRALPLWRVRFEEPEGLSLYIDPWTGEIAARRTDRWRIFDFFWMLHVMDYETRDDFNHLLLQVAAALGLVIGISGVVLWALTTRARRRGRNAVAA